MYFRIFSLVLLLAGSTLSFAEEWFRGLDLEPALSEASLVLAARVADVGETRMILGGKRETTLRNYQFTPLLVLKGVYSRETLSLTSEDLGLGRFPPAARVDRGQVRLLVLGRSRQGYAVLGYGLSAEQVLPPLNGPSDGLVEAVKILLAVHNATDRFERVRLLISGLGMTNGTAAVPLLVSLQRRGLLAAQSPDALEAISHHLSESSPAVREQAAKTLGSVLEADYLDQPTLRQGAVGALTQVLAAADSNFAFRVAAFQALGEGGHAAESDVTRTLLAAAPPATFAEQGARLRAVGQLKISSQSDAVLATLRQMPLDGPPAVEFAAEWSLLRLDTANGRDQIALRLKRKSDAGLPFATEIEALGESSPALAVPLLVDVSKWPLNHTERHIWVASCKKVPDDRLVDPLALLLDPNEPDVRSGAIAALLKIDTAAAAKALQPHLSEEASLETKIEIAEFLGRHGLRDGYPYAIEHMSDPYLRERAISALAAIREPASVGELRKILDSSNDLDWNTAAIEGLGRLGVFDLAPRFLVLARDAKSPLAPAALVALGDLHEVGALSLVRAGLSSRRSDVVIASARAAAQLAMLPGVSASDLRSQLADLLADPGAPLEARAASLDSLLLLKDPRLDGALNRAVRDAGLEHNPEALLQRIEKLLEERVVRLSRP